MPAAINVAPLVQPMIAREYRAIRTCHQSWIRTLDGPWLLFENQRDPCYSTTPSGDRSTPD